MIKLRVKKEAEVSIKSATMFMTQGLSDKYYNGKDYILALANGQVLEFFFGEIIEVEDGLLSDLCLSLDIANNRLEIVYD